MSLGSGAMHRGTVRQQGSGGALHWKEKSVAGGEASPSGTTRGMQARITHRRCCSLVCIIGLPLRFRLGRGRSLEREAGEEAGGEMGNGETEIEIVLILDGAGARVAATAAA